MVLAALFGFLLAFLSSIPIAGPIAALVLSRALEGRRRSAVLVALGGAMAEAIYAGLAFLGFGWVLESYPLIEPISRAAAALILAVLGIAFLRGMGTRVTATERRVESDWGGLVVGASIGGLNPTLIATWTATVAMLHGSGLVHADARAAGPFALGVLGGIVTWFSLLTYLVDRYHERFSEQRLRRVVQFIGAGLLLVAAWFAWRAVQYFTAPTSADVRGQHETPRSGP
jgi:threonine/homoserine/homoserine lactone efflux protein